MATRDLAVKFSTSGFDDLRKQLSAAGKSFDEALKKAKDASQQAIADAKKGAGDTNAMAEAQKEFEKAARAANNAVAGSYRELRIKATSDIEAQKQAAISAYQAIAKSGTASAQDILNAKSSLNQRLKELDKQVDQSKGLSAEEEAAKALEEAYKSLGVTSNESFENQKEAAKLAFEAIKNSGKASFTELATARKAYHDRVKAIEARQRENSPEEVRKRKALEAAQVIENAYKSLGVKSIAELEKQKREAIAAYNAIKNSGVASAKDIRAAKKALENQLERLDDQINENAVGWERLKIQGGKALEALKKKVTTLDLGVRNAGEGFTVLKGVLVNLISGGIQAGLSAIANTIQSIVGGIIGLGQQAVAAFMQFDGAMNQFRAISGANDTEISSVRKEVEKLGMETSKTTTEIALAAVEMSKSGFSAQQIADSLGGIVQASEASGESLSRVGELIGTTINQFGLQAKDSGRVADVLAAAANASATSVSGLGEGLKFIGPIAASANQSMEDMVAILGLLSNAGLDASQTGTNFRSAFIQIQKATAGLTDGTEEGSAALKKKQEMLQQLGVQFRQADGQMRPFIQVLPELAKRLNELDPGTRELITLTLFGTEGAAAITPLVKQVDTKLQGLVDTIAAADGAAAETSKELQKGLAPALERLEASWELLLTGFGEALAPSLEFLVNATMDWVNELGQVEGLLDPVKNLSEEIKGFFEANPEIIETINQEMSALVQDALNAAVELAEDLFGFLKENPTAIADAIRGMAQFVGGVLKGAVNLAESLLNYFKENQEQVAAIGVALQGAGKFMQFFLDLVLKSAEGWGKILYYAKEVFGLAGNQSLQTSKNMIERTYGASGAAAYQAEYDRLEREELNKHWFSINSPLGTLKGDAAQRIAEQAYANVAGNPSAFGLVPIQQGGSESGRAFASGLFTGPSKRIGGSSAYHIDTKIAKSAGEKAAVQMVDQMASAYEAQGRVMEFSNSAVSGIQWDINATLEEKIELLKRLDAAHSHSPNPKYWDMDYYVPKKGQSRHGETVRGVEMMLPTIPGGKVQYSTAGNYGNFAVIYDASGKEVSKTGHGDNARPIPKSRTFEAQTAIASGTPQLNPRSTKAIPGGATFHQFPAANPNQLTGVGNNVLLEREAAKQYKLMAEEVKKAGLTLLPISGYRSDDVQKGLWERQIKKQGGDVAKASRISAPPGYSEHRTGQTLDVTTPSSPGLTADFAKTPEYKWLMSNAAKFGFEMSYGQNNAQGVSFEPWHWRFAGVNRSNPTFYQPTQTAIASGAMSSGGGMTAGGAAPKLTPKERRDLIQMMAAEATGEGVAGMAAVGRAIMNRSALIASGVAPKGTGGYGAKSASVSDVIRGKNSSGWEFSPMGDGRFNKQFDAAVMAEAEQAFNLLMDADALKGLGLSDATINSPNFQRHDVKGGIPKWWQGGFTRVKDHHFGRDKFSANRNVSELVAKTFTTESGGSPSATLVSNQTGGAAVNPMATEAENNAKKAAEELEKVEAKRRQDTLKRRDAAQKIKDREAIAVLKDQHETELEELKRSGADQFVVREQQAKQKLELQQLETKQAIAQLTKERKEIEELRSKKLKTPADKQTSEQKAADYSADIEQVNLKISVEEASLKRTTEKITREFSYIAEDQAKSVAQKQIDEYVRLGSEEITKESNALELSEARREISQTELTYRRATLDAARKQLDVDRLSQQLSGGLIEREQFEPTLQRIANLKEEIKKDKEIAEINYERATSEQQTQQETIVSQFSIDQQKRRLEIAEQTGQISQADLIVEKAKLEIAGKQLEQQQAIAALELGVTPEQKQVLELRIKTINEEIQQTQILTEYQLEQLEIQREQLAYQADYEQITRLIEIAEREGNFQQVESLKLLQAQLDLQSKIAEIKQRGLRPDQEATAIASETRLYELNKKQILTGNRDLGESFREMLSGPLSEFFQGAVDGTKSLSDAFNAMAQSILGSLSRVGAELATNSLLNLLGLGKPQQMQGLGGAIAGMFGGEVEQPTMATVGGGMFGDGIGLAESAVAGFAGVVPANNLAFAPSVVNSPQAFTGMVQPPIAIASEEVTQALSVLTETTSESSDSITRKFTQSILDSTTTQTATTAEFVTSLQIARNAVISFAQSLPGGPTVAAGNSGGNILGTLAKGAVGALTGGIGGFTAGNAAAGLSTANAVASGSFGGFATLPTFKYGGEVEDIPTYKNGGKVDPLRTAIASAFKKEGSGAMLAVMHSGEHVLSDRTGEAQSYRILEQQFGKNPLAKIPMPMFMDGGAVGSVESRLLSGLNSTRMPSISLPTENRRSPVAAGPVSNTVNVNINDRESRFYKQSRTLAREIADELRNA